MICFVTMKPYKPYRASKVIAMVLLSELNYQTEDILVKHYMVNIINQFNLNIFLEILDLMQYNDLYFKSPYLQNMIVSKAEINQISVHELFQRSSSFFSTNAKKIF